MLEIKKNKNLFLDKYLIVAPDAVVIVALA